MELRFKLLKSSHFKRREAEELLRRAAELRRRRSITLLAGFSDQDQAFIGDCRAALSAPARRPGPGAVGRFCQGREIPCRLEEAAKQSPTNTLLNALFLPMMRASVELKRNRPLPAIEQLNSIAHSSGLPGTTYLRGCAYLEAGKRLTHGLSSRRFWIASSGRGGGSKEPLFVGGALRLLCWPGPCSIIGRGHRPGQESVPGFSGPVARRRSRCPHPHASPQGVRRVALATRAGCYKRIMLRILLADDHALVRQGPDDPGRPEGHGDRGRGGQRPRGGGTGREAEAGRDRDGRRHAGVERDRGHAPAGRFRPARACWR